MARKLSKQQHRRVSAKQQQHLDSAPSESSRLGRVVAHFGSHLDVMCDNTEQVIRCQLRANLGGIVCGDNVRWQPSGEDAFVVVAVEPRKSVIERPGIRGQLKLLAANVDAMAIVFAPKPEPTLGLINRMTIAAVHSGVTPILVLNKTDLCSEEELALYRGWLKQYQSIDGSWKAFEISAKNPDTLSPLLDLSQEKTLVITGQSGTGKSSMINALHPEPVTLEGELSEHRTKGRHTTTTATMWNLPSGGHLIDSPGIRTFGLGHLSKDALIQAMPDLALYIDACRFRDCNHLDTKWCGIIQAVTEGKIPEHRYQTYCDIFQENQDLH